MQPRPNQATQIRIGVDGRVLDDRYHGIGRVTDALVRHLAARHGIEVVLVLGASRNSRFDLSTLTSLPNVRTAKMEVALTSPFQWYHWWHLLRSLQVDVMVFPYHLGAGLVGAVPRLAFIQDCILESYPASAPGLGVRLAYRTLTALTTRRTTVLVPTAATAEDVKRLYYMNSSRLSVVPLGVDPIFFRPGDIHHDTTETLALPKRYVLQVGARRPHKNLEVLLRMIALLPDLHLVLVGTIDKRTSDTVPALINDLCIQDRVHHIPFLSEDDLVQAYRQADVFCFPSFSEGFGLPMLEAMAVGTPVVASRIPAFIEVARGAAIFVPPTEPEAWASAVSSIVNNSAIRSRLIEDGFRTAQWHSWDRATNALLLAVTQTLHH